MIVLLVAVACGVIAFSLTFDATHRKPKPPPPPKPDVWQTLASAQMCVDRSLRLIYGERLTAGEDGFMIVPEEGLCHTPDVP